MTSAASCSTMLRGRSTGPGTGDGVGHAGDDLGERCVRGRR
jgi:hypothetical protein